MAGHSKWANIKHRKAAADAKKSKVTTRMVKEITIASKMGGGDPNSNPRLRLAMEKARENNVPKDNVERAIKRGTGELEGVNYEELRFEGYGINGAGVIVDCLTDNKTRTVAEVRHVFTKFGGNLGTDGCVAFQFKHCGQLIFAPGISEDQLMELALEAGADDVISHSDGSFEVLTTPANFIEVKNFLFARGMRADIAEVIMKADNETEMTGDEALRMQKMLDAFDELDDVQEVYTNAVLSIEE
ncbi:MAG: YebC/PmpR family DNA-binding transcriptional regulator [Burkholderiales bacterium]|nr:YebC/PmpR family DNA-binding transcriptional regulator [Burkholderiales bacterium]